MIGYANALGTLAPKYVHLFPTVFFQFHLEERYGMDIQDEIKARTQYCSFDTRP